MSRELAVFLSIVPWELDKSGMVFREIRISRESAPEFRELRVDYNYSITDVIMLTLELTYVNIIVLTSFHVGCIILLQLTC